MKTTLFHLNIHDAVYNPNRGQKNVMPPPMHDDACCTEQFSKPESPAVHRFVFVLLESLYNCCHPIE